MHPMSAIVSPEGEIYYGHKKHSFMKGDEPETDSVPFDLDAGLSIRFVV